MKKLGIERWPYMFLKDLAEFCECSVEDCLDSLLREALCRAAQEIHEKHRQRMKNKAYKGEWGRKELAKYEKFRKACQKI